MKEKLCPELLPINACLLSAIAILPKLRLDSYWSKYWCARLSDIEIHSKLNFDDVCKAMRENKQQYLKNLTGSTLQMYFKTTLKFHLKEIFMAE